MKKLFKKIVSIILSLTLIIGMGCFNSKSYAVDNKAFKIVLSWGSSPRDLDSHICGKSSKNDFHVFYSNKSFSENGKIIAHLDTDDTSSYGPETITLYPKNYNCLYYVYNYSGEGSIAKSSAVVKVYSGDKLLAEFTPPQSNSTARYWTVCRLINGEIYIINELSDSESNVTGTPLRQQHTISNYMEINKNIANIYFGGCGLALDGADETIPDICIPELSEYYGYIPQGIGFSDLLDNILITSYYKKTKKDKGQKTYPSKLFCLDFDGNLTSLYDIKSSDDNYCYGHVGGVAAFAEYIYVANGSKIYCIPFSNLNSNESTAKSSEEKNLFSLLKSTRAKESASCSYVSVTDGILWTGNFFYSKNDDYNTPASDDYNSLIYGFKLNADGTFESNDPTYKINVYWKGTDGKTIDRIQGATVKDNKLYINTSLGKGNDGVLYVVDNINLDNFLVNTSLGSSIQVESSVKRYKSLPMSQGMFFKDNYMYTLCESGAYYYLKEKTDINPTDVVWKIDYKAMENSDGYVVTEGDITVPKYIEFTDDGTIGYTDVIFKQSWFKNDSKQYNHELGQFCSQFSMIGYGTQSELDSALTKMGFSHDDFSENGKSYKCINKSASKEQVNYFISHKNIKVNNITYTLVFAGFIGSYQDQWYSNFDPGTGETHKGFYNAKEYVYEIIQAYLTHINADMNNTKILLTGHSRGAATANLVAAQLINDKKYVAKNIYTYAFATPNSTTLKEKDNTEFKRIFNVVNPEDFVTKCMPNAWGYGRYGTTYTLPSKTNSSEYNYFKRNMQKYYSDFTEGDTYSNFLTGEVATWEVIEAMTLLLPNINCFYKLYLSAGITSMTTDDFFKKTLCRVVSKTASKIEMVEAKTLIFNTLALTTSSKLYKNILLYFLYGGNDVVSDQFIDAHCAQTYCAFMMSMSEFDVKTNRTGLHHSVNCPVDVEIVDKTTDEIVGRIVNNVIDEEINKKENAVVITVDGDSKRFWLPSDGYYDIVLTGNDNGKMDYSVSEIDSDFGEVKRSNFFDVDITDGGSMTGLPEVEEASLNDYGLELGNDETLDSTLILETEDLRGIEIETASFGKGTVTEPQTATMGDYIVLNAAENEDMGESEFIGWFINGELYSTDKSISFVAKEDFSIKAEFTRYLGDSNGDNRINSYDALNVLQYSTDSVLFNQFEFESADVNKDGDIDSLDALMILQYSVGIIEKFESIEE